MFWYAQRGGGSTQTRGMHSKRVEPLTLGNAWGSQGGDTTVSQQKRPLAPAFRPPHPFFPSASPVSERFNTTPAKSFHPKDNGPSGSPLFTLHQSPDNGRSEPKRLWVNRRWLDWCFAPHPPTPQKNTPSSGRTPIPSNAARLPSSGIPSWAATHRQGRLGTAGQRWSCLVRQQLEGPNHYSKRHDPDVRRSVFV